MPLGRFQCVERARDLTGIARHLGHAFLVVVALFERHPRQIDAVLLKPKQQGGVVYQRIGVEREQFGLAGLVDMTTGRRFQRHCIALVPAQPSDGD